MGDFNRYVAEFTVGDKRDEAVDRAKEAYKEAHEINIDSCSPIRLALVLNYAVFQFEVKNKPQKACQLCE